MLSNYGQYIKEKDGIEIVEKPWGFITYKFLDNKIVYIFDCYVRPKSRGKKFAKYFVDIVERKAKQKGYTTNLTSVQITIPNASKNIKTYLGYGYQIVDTKDGIVYLSKEIK